MERKQTTLWEFIKFPLGDFIPVPFVGWLIYIPLLMWGLIYSGWLALLDHIGTQYIRADVPDRTRSTNLDN